MFFNIGALAFFDIMTSQDFNGAPIYFLPLVRIDQITSPVIEFTRTKIVYDKKIVRRGRIWVETKYYDSSGELVEKNAEFIKDYNRLVRWIKKNVPYREIPKGDFLVKEYTNDELMELVKQGYRLTI